MDVDFDSNWKPVAGKVTLSHGGTTYSGALTDVYTRSPGRFAARFGEDVVQSGEGYLPLVFVVFDRNGEVATWLGTPMEPNTGDVSISIPEVGNTYMTVDPRATRNMARKVSKWRWLPPALAWWATLGVLTWGVWRWRKRGQ